LFDGTPKRAHSRQNTTALSSSWREIPYGSEQGIYSAEQGIKSSHQGIEQPHQGTPAGVGVPTSRALGAGSKELARQHRQDGCTYYHWIWDERAMNAPWRRRLTTPEERRIDDAHDRLMDVWQE
jgi:hypothetical protein